jgi:hypothetical protein
MVGLWTWYAFDVHDWRFAAIVWVPLLTRVLAALWAWVSVARDMRREDERQRALAEDRFTFWNEP